MAQYISKSALVAEIERRILEDYNTDDIEKDEVAQGVLASLMYFIGALEVKEEPVSEDLGEYINELSKQFPEVSFAKLSRIAVRVAKWQKEQMMKDAVDAEIYREI